MNLGDVPGDGRSDEEPSKIGRFAIVRELGAGGSGVVLLVSDPTLGCERAMKVPKLETLASAREMDRFRKEAAKAASIDHPNVVRMYEADEIGPVYYQVMEFCPGGSLQDWLKDRPRELEIDQRWAAALMVGICAGVARIHAAGLLHRDLKPGNIMLVRDGQDGDLPVFIPKVGDFGLAKQVARDDPRRSGESTVTGERIGTYLYMSPEQARGTKDLSKQSDVHALGAILYELLTRSRPFGGENTPDLLSNIIHDDPIAPRLHRPRLHPDLETIVLKCLRKLPGRRYESALELADDLQRFLDRRPIRARPISAFERFTKWARRHPSRAVASGLSVSATAALIAALLLFVRYEQAVNLKLMRNAEDLKYQRLVAQDYAATLKSKLKLIDLLNLFEDVRDVNDRLHRRDIFGAQEALHRGEDARGRLGETLFAWRHLLMRSRPLELAWKSESPGAWAAYSKDRRYIYSVEPDSKLVLRDGPTGEALAELIGHSVAPTGCHATSPDGRTFAIGGYDRVTRAFEISFWDVDRSRIDKPGRSRSGPPALPRIERRARIAGEDCGFLATVHFDRAGRSLIVCRATSVPPTWKCDQYRWPLDEARPGPVRSWTSREAELVSPSGDLIAQRTTEKSIDLIETATGRTRQSLPIAEPSSLHFSADGRFLVAASGESGTVWELGSGEPIARFPVTSSATTFEFIPNGRAVMSMDVGGGPIAFHDAVSGRHWSLLPADDDHVHHKDPAVSPDGKWLVTRSGPGVDLPHEPTLWEIDTGRQVVAISNPGSLTYPRQDCFSPDSRSVLMNSEFGAVRWTLGERTDLQPVGHAPEAWAAAFRPDISALATGGDDGRVLFWDRETSALIDGFEAHEGMVSTIAFSKDGSTLLTGSLTDADNLTLWDAATRTAIARFTGHERHVRCAAISPCGNFVASGADDHLARIWDARTGATRHLLSGHEDRVRSLAFSRDGLTLVTASEDKTLRFWNIKTGECTRTIRDEGEVTAVAFSPNGSSIAWVDKVGRVTVKEVGIESRPERVFEAQVGEAWALAFSPGGETLAVAGGNGVVQLWSPETGQEILALEGEGDIRGLAFASDGSALAACRMNGGVQIWRADPEPSKKD